MDNEEVVVQIIDKVYHHGKPFTFYNNKGTDHGMIGKAFTLGFRVFLNGRQIEIQEKGLIVSINTEHKVLGVIKRSAMPRKPA